MPQPHTPSTPTPEDPRQNEPMHDPPVNPEHDIDEEEPVRRAEDGGARDLASDAVVFDADKSER